jgi:hypothetical protein
LRWGDRGGAAGWDCTAGSGCLAGRAGGTGLGPASRR